MISDAEDALKEGLLASRRNIELHYSLGALYEKTGRYREAIAEMEKVLKIDPDNAEALNFIGYTYADRGINLEQAEQMIKKALTLKPGSGYIVDSLGWVYFRQERINEAISSLQEAAAALPEDAAIAEHLGDAYAKAGQRDKALDVYRKALKLNSGSDSLRRKIDDLQGGKK